MRKLFFSILYEYMEKDPRIIFLTGDLGFSLVEPISNKFPDRFYNMQAAEFSMTGAAIGMTYKNKIPIVYSITPFVIFRNMELLRTYVNHENIPVKIIGAGRNKDYKTEGISHYAHDVKAHLDQLSNIVQLWPSNEQELSKSVHNLITNNQPTFLSLSK